MTPTPTLRKGRALRLTGQGTCLVPCEIVSIVGAYAVIRFYDEVEPHRTCAEYVSIEGIDYTRP